VTMGLCTVQCMEVREHSGPLQCGNCTFGTQGASKEMEPLQSWTVLCMAVREHSGFLGATVLQAWTVCWGWEGEGGVG
jgi:hypothetical protein